MKPETRAKREKEKLDQEGRDRLLDNEDFHKFLRFLHAGASEVIAFNARSWLPGWIVTGCELYFTDTQSKIKGILKR